MRFVEFAGDPEQIHTHDSVEAAQSLLTFLRQRYNDQNQVAKFSTHSFIEMMRRTGNEAFNIETFKQIADDPALKNQIKTYNDEEIILNPMGGEDNEDDAEIEKPPAPNLEPEQTVDNMAKRAMSRRQSATI